MRNLFGMTQGSCAWVTAPKKLPGKSNKSASQIVSLYKGEDVALEQGNYRGLKLLDQPMNVLEMVAENL